MNTGAKVAIGCAVAAALAVVVVAAVVIGGAFWVKGKVHQLTADNERIESLQKQANQVAFTPPADGRITEDRLLAFLEIRKRVYAVYQPHQQEIEAAAKKGRADLSDVTQAVSLINDLRLAHAEAAAEVGMSQDEYAYMVRQVYKTMWAAEVSKQTGGKSVSEASGQAMDQMAEQLDQMQQQEGLTDEQREQMAQGHEQLQAQAQEARTAAQQLDVPPENITLFRKHEKEIRQYAMNGLEMLGVF